MSDSPLSIFKHSIPAGTIKPKKNALGTSVDLVHNYLPLLVYTEIPRELNDSEQGSWTTDLKSLATPGSIHLICVYLNIIFNKIRKPLPPSVLP